MPELGDITGPVQDIDKCVDHRLSEDAVKAIASVSYVGQAGRQLH